MITVAEEQELWMQYAVAPSPEVREQLVLQGVPLVHYMLGRLGISREIGGNYEDLVHQGLLGLIDAVDRFDPQQGTRFSTYASIRIRGKVLDYLRSSDWLSRTSRKRARLVQKGITSFWAEKQHEPSDEELAAFLGLEVEEVRQGLSDSNTVIVSLDADVSGEEDEGSLYETLEDENQTDPSEIFLEQDRKTQLMQAIRELPQREQQVLSLYYSEELTFKDIGKILAVSELRVCQLHARAIHNIEACLKHE